MVKWFFFLMLFARVALAADVSPPCFRDLEYSFFDRRIVTEALSFTRIQNGLWELIVNDLKARTPRIHQQVLRLAQSESPNPMNHPFNMLKAKEVLEKVLFRNLQDAMRTYKYNFVREGDIERVYEFIKAKNQHRWDLCQ